MGGIKGNHAIIIQGLSPKTTQSDIRGAFRCCGIVRFVKIIMNKHTGHPRGFAILTYDDQHEAEDAIMNMDGMTLHGYVLTINKVQNNMSRSDSGFYSRGYRDNRRTCFICGSHGHLYRRCPDLDGDDDGDSCGDDNSGGGGCPVDVCYKCGEPGHFARECYNQGINPTPAEAAAVLRRANSSLKEIVVTAPQVKGSNGGRLCPMRAESVPSVRSVNPKSKETSDKVTLQVNSGNVADPKVPPRLSSGKRADPAVPPQVSIAKKAGPADMGIFSDEDAKDIVLKLENTTVIKGFPVPNKYVTLYNTIYDKHGHIATKTVITNSMMALFGLVVDILAVITEMKETSHLDFTPALLDHWMSKVSTAEAVKFNIGWLRTIVDKIVVHSACYEVFSTMVESDVEKHKKIEEEFVEATELKETLKVQLLAAEEHATEVEKKLNESQILVKKQLEVKKRIIARQHQSVLTDLL